MRIACSKNNLKDIRNFVSQTLHTLCVAEHEIEMMVLAVDEVCANRIIHSNNNDETLYLELKIMEEKQGISFEIMDEGEPFDPTNLPENNIPQLIKEKRKGGLGLMLVRKIMDSFEVKTENEYTVCKLFKKINLC
jgi:serine/threonine-protein kinase RsbW